MADEETNVEEQEIIVETEAEETDEKVEVEEPPKQEEPAKSSGDEELDSYSKGVQTRIKKLTEKYRQEERDKAEAVRLSPHLIE